ncbi:MAG: hypothetical protein PHX14_11780 [Syntrophomonadaceae bacterium]|nr:hypothetical protein [Syntrophomonadaceae bacterium]
MQENSAVNRLRRYVLPILAIAIVGGVIGHKTGAVSKDNLWYGLLLPAVLELLFIIICLVNISKIVRRYRRLRSEGREGLDALQSALEIVVSPRIARMATLEPRLYRALYLSFKGKAGADEKPSFDTRKDSYAFLVKVFIFLCLLEIAVVTALLPQKWMIWKVLHLLLGLWAIMFLWADYRAMDIYNHGLRLTGMNLRLGLRCNLQIAWDDIAKVRRISQAAPNGTMSPGMVKRHPGLFYLGLGDICNMEIILKGPGCFQGMVNEIPGVTNIMLSLEKPDDFTAQIQSIKPELYAAN